MARFLMVFVGLVTLTAPAVRANEIQPELRKQFHPAAELVARLMVVENLSKLVVGEFSPPTDPPKTGYGTGAQVAFVAEFEEVVKSEAFAGKNLGIVGEKGDLEINARMNYRSVTIDDKDTAVIEVRFGISQKKGKFILAAKLVDKLQQDAVVIGKPETVRAVLAQTGRLVPTATKEEKKKAIEAVASGATKSPVDIDKGTRVRAVPGSPYAVEILVVDEKDAPKTLDGWAKIAKAHPVTLDGMDKHPLVELKPNQAYAIRVHNDSAFDAAVEVFIDGIDVFHFVDDALKKDGKPICPYYIVPRKTEGGLGIIPGWHKDNSTSHPFVTRDYGKGGGSKLPGAKPGRIGVITLRFAASWKEAKEPPAEFRERRSNKLEVVKGLEARTVESVMRVAGPFRETISIRYSH